MWTSVEIALLRANASLGAAELADQLGRSVSSVTSAAHRQGISLRTPGSRRGTVLGQPRGMRLSGVLREDLVSRAGEATLIAERMRIDAEAILCPSCGRRPQRVIRTGLCRPCHLAELQRHHLEAIDELDARRALLTSRKALERARRHHAQSLGAIDHDPENLRASLGPDPCD
jgi:hypothetical protein